MNSRGKSDGFVWLAVTCGLWLVTSSSLAQVATNVLNDGTTVANLAKITNLNGTGGAVVDLTLDAANAVLLAAQSPDFSFWPVRTAWYATGVAPTNGAYSVSALVKPAEPSGRCRLGVIGWLDITNANGIVFEVSPAGSESGFQVSVVDFNAATGPENATVASLYNLDGSQALADYGSAWSEVGAYLPDSPATLSLEFSVPTAADKAALSTVTAHLSAKVYQGLVGGNPVQVGRTIELLTDRPWPNIHGFGYFAAWRSIDFEGSAIGQLSNLTFVGQLTILNVPPAVAITSPANGTALPAPADLPVTAAASDPDDTVAKIELFSNGASVASSTSRPATFLLTNLPPGSYNLTARAIDSRGAVGFSAPVLVEIYKTNYPPTVAITSPKFGDVFLIPAAITVSASASDRDGSITNLQLFSNTKPIGSFPAGAGTVVLTNLVPGLYTFTAKATDNEGAETTSAAVPVTVRSNAPPTVALTSPLNNTLFTAPAAITLTATADDSDGTIVKVEFYRGAELVGTSTESPPSVVLNAAPPGSYTFTAKAIDNDGGSATSAPVTVTVNDPPRVSITSPANNATFGAPAQITLTAAASDSDGAVVKVEFYSGTDLLGTRTSTPYNLLVTNVAVGAYTYTAKATDNQGASTTSTPVNVTVAKPNDPPVVAITNPANNTTVAAPAKITLTADASDPDGTVAKVEFYSGASLVGTITSAPFTLVVSNLSVGTYTYTAKATDNQGAATTSAPVKVIVQGQLQAMLKNPASTGPKQFSFLVTGIAGADYDVETSSDLRAWTKIASGTAPSSSFSLAYSDLSARYLFFRLKLSGTPATNRPPVVSLSSPTNNATYTAPATITLTALASDPDGRVTNVEFYAGATLVGSSTNTPASIVLPSVPAGAYTYTAKAFDDKGAATTSAPVTVRVETPAGLALLKNPASTAPKQFSFLVTGISGAAYDVETSTNLTSWTKVASGNAPSDSFLLNYTNLAGPKLFFRLKVSGGTVTNKPPVVDITSPANNAILAGPTNLTLTATATDPDGRVVKVEFYSGGALLGTSTNTPASFTLTNVSAGAYTYTAKAYDDKGAVTTSSPVVVTITGAGAGPTLKNPTLLPDAPRFATFQFTVAGLTGSRYQVDSSADLRTWTPVTNAPIAGATVDVRFPKAAGKQLFYRVVVTP